MIIKPCYFDAAITILPEENFIKLETVTESDVYTLKEIDLVIEELERYDHNSPIAVKTDKTDENFDEMDACDVVELLYEVQEKYK